MAELASPLDSETDSDNDDEGFPMELLRHLSDDELRLFTLVRDAELPGNVPAKALQKLDGYIKDAEDYRQDVERNWEVVVEREGPGLAALATEALEKEDLTGDLETEIKKVLVRSNSPYLPTTDLG